MYTLVLALRFEFTVEDLPYFYQQADPTTNGPFFN